MHRTLAISTLIRVAMLAIAPALSATVPAADFEVEVPLTRAASGNYYVTGVLNAAVRSDFLVDTGSGLVTINERLFDALRAHGAVERGGRVAARMADGRLEAVQLYRVASFRIGEHCDLGAVEVAVMPGGANILGLNLLSRAAPFAVHVTPPVLALSACGLAVDQLAAR